MLEYIVALLDLFIRICFIYFMITLCHQSSHMFFKNLKDQHVNCLLVKLIFDEDDDIWDRIINILRWIEMALFTVGHALFLIFGILYMSEKVDQFCSWLLVNFR